MFEKLKKLDFPSHFTREVMLQLYFSNINVLDGDTGMGYIVLGY